METSVKINILIVDDKPANLISLEAVLAEPGVNIVKAGSGNEALALILEYDFALVLLDVQMPDMDGFETAELMRGNKKTRHVPIIFVTAASKEARHIFRGYESGAVDYIFKPLEPRILKNKVRVFMDLYRQKMLIENKNAELAAANRKILDQQSALVEEERLKVLLKIAGAAAHEINLPLTMLLGHIEILCRARDDHGKIKELLPGIQKACGEMSDIIKKIQHIGHDGRPGNGAGTDLTALDRDVDLLAVEDSDLFFNLIAAYFKKNENIKLSRAKTIKETLARLARAKPDLILLDYELPDGTGLELLEKLGSKRADIPVVAITGMGNEEIASSFLKAGAYDYLAKSSISRASLFQAVGAALGRFGMKKEFDRSIRKMAEMSTRDQLTGLYNRRYMTEVLDREFERSRRYGTDLSCLLLDLDFFKRVNDQYGHPCGDFVLQEFSRRLLANKRHSDYVCRYGGEEFIMLLPQVDIQGALRVAEKIRGHCSGEPYEFETHRLGISVSIGAASVEGHGVETAEDLVKYSDKGLYKAKASGRNCVKTHR